MSRLPQVLKRDVRVFMPLILGVFFALVAIFTLYAIAPVPSNVYGDFSDGSYWQGIDALLGTHASYFLPNRLVTGAGFLLLIIALSHVVGSVSVAWLIINGAAFVGIGVTFYVLAEHILQNKTAAFLSTLIVIFNYGPLIWALNYAADGPGWFFFIAALYCAWRYLESGKDRSLWQAVALVALGGVFKEYALCAYIGIALVLVLRPGRSWFTKFFLIGVTGLACLVPFVIANTYTWFAFHYTYIDWWIYNKTVLPVYPGTYLDEYIKILGSIFNVMWFIFIPGLFLFWKRRKEILHDRRLQFIVVASLASLPVWIWMPFPRIFFIMVPSFALITGLFLAKVKRPWVYAPLFVAYILWGYLMDAVILPLVNIQPILHMLHF